MRLSRSDLQGGYTQLLSLTCMPRIFLLQSHYPTFSCLLTQGHFCSLANLEARLCFQFVCCFSQPRLLVVSDLNLLSRFLDQLADCIDHCLRIRYCLELLGCSPDNSWNMDLKPFLPQSRLLFRYRARCCYLRICRLLQTYWEVVKISKPTPN